MCHSITFIFTFCWMRQEEVQDVRQNHGSHSDMTSFHIRSNFWVKEERELRLDIEEPWSWVVDTVTKKKAERKTGYPGKEWEFCSSKYIPLSREFNTCSFKVFYYVYQIINMIHMAINNASMSVSPKFSPFPKSHYQKSILFNCLPFVLMHPFTKRLENVFLLLFQNAFTLDNIY